MNKKNLVIDILIFSAFLTMESPNLSGNTIHEWLGLALLGTFVVHVFMHLDWITSVGKAFFKKLWHSSRLKFVLDILVFLSIITVSLSGIMISKTALPALGISLGQVSSAWRQLHSLAADAAILMVGLHFALNWGIVVKMFKKYIFSPLGSLFHHNKFTQQPVEVRIDERR
jgi:hypothetical protein